MSVQGLITRGSRRRGLDPRAVLAVASAEGLGSTRPGDHGTSFGPFQLHMGGALPRAHYGDAQGWASSPEGIAYALNEIAKVARGLHGREAIAAIVRRFEKPAAPGAEIQKASSRYGKVGGGEAGVATAPSVPAAGQAAAPDRHEIAMQLIQTLGQDHPDVGALIPLVAAGKAASQAKAPQAHTRANRGDIGASTEASSEHTSEDARVVASARKWLGTPYVYGGQSKSGIDCSALLQRIWGDAGVKIARTTYEQFQQGTAVKRGQLRAGDAVFFRGSDPKNGLPGHVAVYIGNGRIIEAPHTGTRVRVSKLAGRSDYVGARRYG